MARWDDVQDAILREFCHMGAEACRDIIGQRTGIVRSVDATWRHANRIGASCFQFAICPRCGRKAKRLMPETGLCKACNELHRAEEQRRFNIRLSKEINMLEKGIDYEYVANKRRHDAIRQENSRLCRRHGLPGLRERKSCGDSVDLSKSLSKGRSDGQEIS